jgi:hypothetical protein
MKVRSIVRNAIIGLGFCVAALPLFAQNVSPGPQTQLPQALQLQAIQGKSGVYQDALGQTYTVNPESGGSLCDPQGCMVQVCSAGGCQYYYCTTVKCSKVSPTAVSKKES